jgi:hypothetical protein
VDGVRDQLLSRACFAQDEDGRIRGRNSFNLFQNPLQSPTSTNNPLKFPAHGRAVDNLEFRHSILGMTIFGGKQASKLVATDLYKRQAQSPECKLKWVETRAPPVRQGTQV